MVRATWIGLSIVVGTLSVGCSSESEAVSAVSAVSPTTTSTTSNSSPATVDDAACFSVERAYVLWKWSPTADGLRDRDVIQLRVTDGRNLLSAVDRFPYFSQAVADYNTQLSAVKSSGGASDADHVNRLTDSVIQVGIAYDRFMRETCGQR